jgi:hypothetical protein
MICVEWWGTEELFYAKSCLTIVGLYKTKPGVWTRFHNWCSCCDLQSESRIIPTCENNLG